jgi:hypothetical protein
MTDNSSLVRRRDSKAATGRPPAVPAKAMKAIRVLLEQPKADLEAAAKAAGLTTYWLRRYLKQPHVAKYFRDERRAVLDSICAGNPVALKAIRDESKNKMAAVAAVRGLELMRNEEQEGAPGRFAQQSPGVTIIIESAPGVPAQVIGAPVIDVTPGADESQGDPDFPPS